MLKNKRFLLGLILVLLVVNLGVYSYADNLTTESFINSTELIKVDNDFIKEDQINIFNDLINFFNQKSNNLLNNSYYLKINNEIKEIQNKHQDNVLNKYKKEYPEYSYLFNNTLQFDQFIKLDKELINKNNDSSIIQKQKNIFEEILLKSKDYYIKTDLEVKIYPSFITEFNNNLQTAIQNRENLLNKKYDSYNTSYFYPKITRKDKDLILRRLSKEENIMNFFVNLEIYNFIDINPILLKDLEVYITPFELDNIEAYAYLGEITSRGAYESIYIAKETNRSNLTMDSINKIKSTSLHELGHIIEGRSGFKGLEYNIFNNYQELNFKPKEKHSKKTPYYTISGYDLKHQDGHDEWEENLSENFAEDFKVFISDKLADHLKYNDTTKQTIFEYNDRVKSIFEKTLYYK